MSTEEKQRLKEYQKNYREARKTTIFNNLQQPTKIYFSTHYYRLKWHI